MLMGLCHWHSKTQAALLPVVGQLHLLEQIASDQHIGTLAENLLETLMENAKCQEAVSVSLPLLTFFSHFSLLIVFPPCPVVSSFIDQASEKRNKAGKEEKGDGHASKGAQVFWDASER